MKVFTRLLVFILLISTPAIARDGVVIRGLFFNSYMLSTHEGAYHQLHGLSLPGGVIKLEDDSEWVVAPYYWNSLKEWTTGDTLLITSYRPWFFHYYEFKLINERTQDVVLVNWCRPPQVNNLNTRKILCRHSYEIVLDDGTRWRIKGSDRPTMRSWRPGDIIVIGTNDDWFSWSNPNLLINMHFSSCVRGAAMPKGN